VTCFGVGAILLNCARRNSFHNPFLLSYFESDSGNNPHQWRSPFPPPSHYGILQEGTVTAGNASGVNDGAAALVLASGSFVTSRNLKPRAKIIGFAQCGLDPKVMGLGPVPAIQLLVSALEYIALLTNFIFEYRYRYSITMACSRNSRNSSIQNGA